jgi:DNA-directed RNA polymerase subunit M/transcription elongation factor TFIIS
VALKNWIKGKTSVVAEVLCCPECGSLQAWYRGKPDAARESIYWECEGCGHRWKGTAKKLGRGVVIG